VDHDDSADGPVGLRAGGRASLRAAEIGNRQQLLAEFDKGVTEARKALAGTSDPDMLKDWTLLAGGQTIFTMPRVACLRGMVLNHMIHHRAQLTVYYRLLKRSSSRPLRAERRRNAARG